MKACLASPKTRLASPVSGRSPVAVTAIWKSCTNRIFFLYPQLVAWLDFYILLQMGFPK
jgi:hypothetical protein